MAKGRVKVHLLLSKVKLRGLKVFTMCVVCGVVGSEV